jgi:pyruvate kinase
MKALFDAGADLFRINMSHTSHTALAEMHRHLRGLEADAGRPVGILIDLQGPKIRLGTLPGGQMLLSEAKTVRVVRRVAAENEGDIPIPHAEVFAAIGASHALLIDDGKVRLKVTSAGTDWAECIVEVGGVIKDRKGVNLPDTVLPIPAMTPKDRSDLDAGLNLGIDWVALSFVQRPEDVAELKKVVGGRASVLAKIEKPKALDWLDDILDIADAVMVARGDLGVELPLEAVPGIQKRITRAGRKKGKPVVVATQMLESMVTHAVPTRAEVSDVATAVFDGADAVMLSAETASGAHPIEAVKVMDRTAISVESDALYQATIEAQRSTPEATTPDAIMAAVHEVTKTIHARAIVCWTKSGSTALRAARERSDAPIVVLTPEIQTARKLSIGWGLHCVHTEDAQDLDDMVERASAFACMEGFAKSGDRIVITAGVPLGMPGATNMLRVAFVK